MCLPFFLTISIFLALVAAQYYEGYELDEPMLRAIPNRTSPMAMLRFGCSQVVIERLDPYVSHPEHSKSEKKKKKNRRTH
jgi:hypothetical protein